VKGTACCKGAQWHINTIALYSYMHIHTHSTRSRAHTGTYIYVCKCTHLHDSRSYTRIYKRACRRHILTCLQDASLVRLPIEDVRSLAAELNNEVKQLRRQYKEICSQVCACCDGRRLFFDVCNVKPDSRASQLSHVQRVDKLLCNNKLLFLRASCKYITLQDHHTMHMGAESLTTRTQGHSNEE